MTEEELNKLWYELEKEADDYVHNHWTEDEEHDVLIKQAYLAGAEPREKQIKIDAEQILALQKQNGELTDKVKELEKENNNYKLAEIEAKEIMAELEDKLANADYQLEGRDNEIEELEETINKLREQFALRYGLEDKVKELEQFIKNTRQKTTAAIKRV